MVDALGLMNLSTVASLAFQQALSTVVARDVSKLYIINAHARVSLPYLSLLFPRRTNFGAKLTPGTATIFLYRDFMYFCGLVGSIVENRILL